MFKKTKHISDVAWLPFGPGHIALNPLLLHIFAISSRCVWCALCVRIRAVHIFGRFQSGVPPSLAARSSAASDRGPALGQSQSQN